jgi:hypothetical protein
MSSFSRMCTVTASRKRLPAISGGKRGAAVDSPVLGTFKCTPLDPVSAEIQQRVATGGGMELVQTFTETTDIREGDILVVASVDYPIRSCAEWTWRGSTVTRHLVLEVLKR